MNTIAACVTPSRAIGVAPHFRGGLAIRRDRAENRAHEDRPRIPGLDADAPAKRRRGRRGAIALRGPASPTRCRHGGGRRRHRAAAYCERASSQCRLRSPVSIRQRVPLSHRLRRARFVAAADQRRPQHHRLSSEGSGGSDLGRLSSRRRSRARRRWPSTKPSWSASSTPNWFVGWRSTPTCGFRSATPAMWQPASNVHRAPFVPMNAAARWHRRACEICLR